LLSQSIRVVENSQKVKVNRYNVPRIPQSKKYLPTCGFHDKEQKHPVKSKNSHFERIRTEGEGRLSKRSISAKALVGDIRKGLPDAELMSRYELSEGQLQKIFVQLIKAGYVAQEALDGRKQPETETSSAGIRGSGVAAAGNEVSSSEPPRSVPPQRHDPQSGRAQPSSRSLPLSGEEAARVRRNGLILILASIGFVTMRIVLAKLQASGEFVSFPINDVVVVLRGLAGIGWLVTVILGCWWRVRGLGQHPVWAIVAPLNFVNLIVIEALSNRYEPQSDRRDLRVSCAIFGQFAWAIAWSQIIKIL
jgi:hypothetical protein